jgi:redox-sensitive bicupin YhaK (pirin superfamily)
MTAGRGIIHSEMPKQEDGLLWGFQLWVNLPSSKKMVAPRYQDIEPSRIPEVKANGATVRVIAGESSGAKGPVEGIVTEPLMLDVRLDVGASFRQPVPAGHNAFAYVFDGEVTFGDKRVRRGELAVLAEGDAIATSADGAGGKFLLLAGKPIGEPVARYGPFVMNTEREIRQAILDFQSGRLA